MHRYGRCPAQDALLVSDFPNEDGFAETLLMLCNTSSYDNVFFTCIVQCCCFQSIKSVQSAENLVIISTEKAAARWCYTLPIAGEASLDIRLHLLSLKWMWVSSQTQVSASRDSDFPKLSHLAALMITSLASTPKGLDRKSGNHYSDKQILILCWNQSINN